MRSRRFFFIPKIITFVADSLNLCFMRRMLLAVFVLVSMSSRGQSNLKENRPAKSEYPASFGIGISPGNATEAAEMARVYQQMAITDTLDMKFRGEIREVCPVKGCWMKIVLTDDTEVMVRFRDYGFFVPSDIIGREAILSGSAFTEMISVEDQRHYAQDAGMTPIQVAAIREPLKAYSLVADGVLIGD
jgi:hypothetical protein